MEAHYRLSREDVDVLAGDAFLLKGELRRRQTSLGEASARTGLAKGSIREAIGFIGARVNYSSGTPERSSFAFGRKRGNTLLGRSFGFCCRRGRRFGRK